MQPLSSGVLALEWEVQVDLVYVGLTLLFFLVSAAYVRGCDRL